MEIARNIDAAFLAGLSAEVIHPVVLVYVNWPGDPVYVHSGIGNLSFDGQTWVGAQTATGRMVGSLSVPPEAQGGIAQEAELLLATTVEQALDTANNQAARNAEVDIYLGLVTEPSGTTLIGLPTKMFTGYVNGSSEPDIFTLSEDGQTANLRVPIRAGQSARAAAQITHSDEDQQSAYPGDTFFRRVSFGSSWREVPPTWPV